MPATTGLAFELNEDGNSYMVAGIGSATDTNLVIPEEYEGSIRGKRTKVRIQAHNT